MITLMVPITDVVQPDNHKPDCVCDGTGWKMHETFRLGFGDSLEMEDSLGHALYLDIPKLSIPDVADEHYSAGDIGLEVLIRVPCIAQEKIE